MELMFQPFRKYADFTGRARRSEYWLFFLFNFIIFAIVGFIDAASGRAEPPLLLSFILGVYLLASFIPSLALSFRRLHDTNRTAWWVLIGIIPILGGLVLLIFSLLDGTPGDNKYGPDPKGRAATGTLEAFT